MLRRIILGLLLVVAIVLAYVGYSRWQQDRAMLTGEVSGSPGPLDSVASIAPPSTEIRPPARSQTTTIYPPAAISDNRPSAISPPSGTATSDSMPANPPNGMAYAGTGRFQVYRQGNLTYRLDTDNGRYCILYATDEEWRKPRVYRHGCGNSVAQ